MIAAVSAFVLTAGLVAEVKTPPDSIIQALNAQHHQLRVLERRSVPGPFTPAEMKFYSSHAVKAEDLPVINPGPSLSSMFGLPFSHTRDCQACY